MNKSGSQDRIGRTGKSGLGKGPGDSVQTESAPGCVSNNVLGQPQGFEHGEARERATSVDTRGVQVREVRQREGGYECEPGRLNDETVAKAPN